MREVLVTAPASEPVSLDQAKAFLRLTGTAEDTDLGLRIAAARQAVENFTGRALITQTWRRIMSAFPSADTITLDRAPLASVTSLKYYPADGGAIITWDTANYVVSLDLNALFLAPGIEWPATAIRPDAVQVEFTAGGNTSAVPPALRHAVFFILSHWWEQRLPVAAPATAAEIPLTARHLLESYRVTGWLG